ncbi:SHANK [Mytilus edulis]|uniref:SHANK n=1 Tax=Mytilus edulis TaxID=6550 RepID=A0A8S3TJ67_MYTED|nr:SHANK [Mytilus edulis]
MELYVDVFRNNTTGEDRGAGILGITEVTPVYGWVCFAQTFSFYVIFLESVIDDDQLQIYVFIEVCSLLKVLVVEKELGFSKLLIPTEMLNILLQHHALNYKDVIRNVSSETLQSSQGYIYGTSNDGNGYFSCMDTPMERRGVNDVYDDFEEYSDTELQSPLNVIAIKSYVAKQEHELTLQKDAKFDVIGRISNAWLIGVLDGRRGTFPAECVKDTNTQLTIETRLRIMDIITVIVIACPLETVFANPCIEFVCDCQGTVVNCNQKNLVSIPDGIPTTTT